MFIFLPSLCAALSFYSADDLSKDHEKKILRAYSLSLEERDWRILVTEDNIQKQRLAMQCATSRIIHNGSEHNPLSPDSRAKSKRKIAAKKAISTHINSLGILSSGSISWLFTISVSILRGGPRQSNV